MGNVFTDIQLVGLKLIWELSGYGNEFIQLKEWIYNERKRKERDFYQTQDYLYLLANGVYFYLVEN